MHLLKKIFSSVTGYWIHKISSLPVGADLYLDIHHRFKYGRLKTMFDVGANTGQTLEWFRKNEPAAKIYCFEPVSDSYNELKIKARKDPNCIVEHIAFGEQPGEKVMKLFDGDSSLNSLSDRAMNQNSDANEETVKIETLDNYCLKNGISKIDFLKIDTEGYELNVLQGSVKMLNDAAISFIYCEIGFLKQNERNTYFADLTEWLAVKDYHFFGLYQLVSNGWGLEFGNALFVHRNILKQR